MAVLGGGPTDAKASDLDRPENDFEEREGGLLEVYTDITSPEGKPLLFEVYHAADEVAARQREIMGAFRADHAGRPSRVPGPHDATDLGTHQSAPPGLSQLLEAAPGIEVVGSAAGAAAALEVVADTSPDVVLMDLQMAGTDGVTATREIVASGSPAQVVILTSYSDGERIVAALDAGESPIHPGLAGSCWSPAPDHQARTR